MNNGFKTKLMEIKRCNEQLDHMDSLQDTFKGKLEEIFIDAYSFIMDARDYLHQSTGNSEMLLKAHSCLLYALSDLEELDKGRNKGIMTSIIEEIKSSLVTVNNLYEREVLS